MNPTELSIILVTHWLADFCFQTRYQAVNKSKNIIALLRHIVTYSLCFIVPVTFLLGIKATLLFVAVTGILHFKIDYITSRIMRKLWTENEYYSFFVMLGLDQLLHYICLISAYIIIHNHFIL